jgi:hypothetical protein
MRASDKAQVATAGGVDHLQPSLGTDRHPGFDVSNPLLAGLLLASVSGFVAFVGYLREEAYYARLGVPLYAVKLPVEHYMAASFWILINPVLVVAFYLLLEFLVQVSRNKMPGSEPAYFVFFSPASVFAMAGVLSGTWAYAAIGDEAPRVLGVSSLDVLVWIAALVVVGAVAVGQLRPDSTLSLMLGKSMPASVLLLAVGVLGFAIAATSAGVSAGSAAAFACVPLPLVELEPAPAALSENHTYWLVAHVDDAFYLRDLATPGHSQNLTIVQAPSISAVISWMPANAC